MKLWKDNLIAKEYEMPNEEIAKRFMQSEYYKCQDEGGKYGGYKDYRLVLFISGNEADGGLASTWDWDRAKGSINGSPDIIEILDKILPRLEKESL